MFAHNPFSAGRPAHTDFRADRRWWTYVMRVEIEMEEDGIWIGEVPALPGVTAYGATEAEARSSTEALACRVITDRLEHGEPVPPGSAASVCVSPWPSAKASRVLRALLRIGWNMKRQTGSQDAVYFLTDLTRCSKPAAEPRYVIGESRNGSHPPRLPVLISVFPLFAENEELNRFVHV
jgi:predicted RNase H-like HicB family nuclease